MINYNKEIKNIIGKNFKITGPIKDYIQTEYNQLRSKVLKKYDKINVKFILSIDKSHKIDKYKCELMLNYRDKTYKIIKESNDMYNSINLCLFTAKELIIKQKEKKSQLKNNSNTIRKYNPETHEFYSNLYHMDDEDEFEEELEELEEVEEEKNDCI